MYVIDNFAYNNRLRDVDPAYKFGLVVAFLGVCLLSHTPLIGIASLILMSMLAVLAAKIPAKYFMRILASEFAFFVLATLGVAVSITLTDPTVVNPWSFQIGPFWLSSGPEPVQAAWLIVARVMGGVAAMNFLALTTPMTDLIALAQRCRLPDTLIDLTSVMYRYIFVLFETLTSMRDAQESRLGYSKFKNGISSAGLLASRLFIETYQRSKNIQIALDSRGYRDQLNVLPIRYRTNIPFFCLAGGAMTMMVLLWVLA